MRYCKNIRFILSCILLSCVVDLQSCSETNSAYQIISAPPSSPNKRARRKSFIIDIQDTVPTGSKKTFQTPRELLTPDECFMREALLKKYDPDVIDLWMNRYDLNRIAFHASLQNATRYAVLDKLIGISSALNNKKIKITDSLYAAHIKNNHIEKNKDKERDHLWLEKMYSHRDNVHRYVEAHKQSELSNSLVAWPFIKEIQKIKKFPLNKN